MNKFEEEVEHVAHTIKEDVEKLEEIIENDVEKVWHKMTYACPCKTPGCERDCVPCPDPSCVEMGENCPSCHGKIVLCPNCDAKAYEKWEEVIWDATENAIGASSTEDNVASMV